MGDGSVEVDSIEQIELADITAALARESGFASVVDLLKIAKHGPGNNVYLVRFHYVAASKVRAVKSDGERSRGAKSLNSDKQRKRIARIVEQLPDAAAIAHGKHMSLEVRKKRFGWFLDDHHGDHRIALNCKASADMHDVLKQLAPKQFHIPKYVGNKGWIGLWLDVPGIDWPTVELALREAYLGVAPKTLQRVLSGDA
jgi:hypothetical protein